MAGSLSPLFTWRSAIAESDLSPTPRLVALVLSMHMSELGDSCFPSLETVARQTGRDRSTVQRAIRVLEDQGFLKVQRGQGRGHTSRYTATTPDDLLEKVAYRHLSRAEKVAYDAEKVAPTPPESVKRAYSPPSPNGSGGRPADPIFEMLVETCYPPGSDWRTFTRSEQTRIGRVRAELARVGASAADVANKAAAYRRHPTYKDCALTVNALLEHWSELTARRGASAAACPECGVSPPMHAADCTLIPEQTQAATAG